MDLHPPLKLTFNILVTIIAFKTWKLFSLNFSEGNLATKQVIFLQRPVMWSSTVQTPEVSNMFVILVLKN